MCFSSGDGGQSAAAQQQADLAQQQADQAAAAESKRQAGLSQGMDQITSAFAPFNDDFYAGQTKAYEDYANPQLNDQFAEAKRQLSYALSRSGNLQSSIAAKDTGDLTKQYNLGQQQIVDTGNQYATNARSSVEGARSNLVSELNATADPNVTAQAIPQTVTGLQTNPVYSPLGQVFAGVLGSLNTAAQYSAANGNPYPFSGMSPALFSNTSASSVVH